LVGTEDTAEPVPAKYRRRRICVRDERPLLKEQNGDIDTLTANKIFENWGGLFRTDGIV
jgi:hypothetical protein